MGGRNNAYQEIEECIAALISYLLSSCEMPKIRPKQSCGAESTTPEVSTALIRASPSQPSCSKPRRRLVPTTHETCSNRVYCAAPPVYRLTSGSRLLVRQALEEIKRCDAPLLNACPSIAIKLLSSTLFQHYKPPT
jgi:hypothetical protein